MTRTAYRWTSDGDLVCHDHRTGRAAQVVASNKGGAL
jgi:YD repeat-containing protein